jgi:hypothetical protein
MNDNSRYGKVKYAIGQEVKVITGRIIDADSVYIIHDDRGTTHHVPKSIAVVTFSSEGSA